MTGIAEEAASPLPGMEPPEAVAALLEAAAADALRPGATDQQKRYATSAMLLYGRVDRAAELLGHLMASPPAGQTHAMNLVRRLREGEALRAACAGPDAAGAGPRAPGEAPEIMVAPSPGAAQVLVVFGGQNNRFWGPNKTLIIGRQKLHLIFLRLCGNRMYLAGIDGLGADYPACLDALGRIIARLPVPPGRTPRVTMMGHSIGGYAAMRFGLDLGAASVLAFSAPTRLDLGADRDAHLQTWPQLRELYARAPEMAIDLRRVWRHAARTPRLTLCYGAGNHTAEVAAQRLAEFPGVRLLPLDGYEGHEGLREAEARGVLKDLLVAALSAG